MQTTIALYQESDQTPLVDAIFDLQETERVLSDTRISNREIAGRYLEELKEISANKNGAIFVAHTDGVVSGFVACWVERENNVAETPDSNAYGYVSDAYVAPEYRRLGIFKQLDERTSQYFSQFPEISRIRICTLGNNLPALAAYEKTGYTKYEIILEKKIR